MTTKGRLRHKVELQRKSSSGYDSLGQPIGTWQTIDTFPAKVEDLSGRELERARQMVSEATVRVISRFRSNIKTTDRLVFRERVLEIGRWWTQVRTGRDTCRSFVAKSSTSQR